LEFIELLICEKNRMGYLCLKPFNVHSHHFLTKLFNYITSITRQPIELVKRVRPSCVHTPSVCAWKQKPWWH